MATKGQVPANRKHGNNLNEDQLREKISNYTWYLNLALERLFTDSDQAGFWGAVDGRNISDEYSRIAKAN